MLRLLTSYLENFEGFCLNSYGHKVSNPCYIGLCTIHWRKANLGLPDPSQKNGHTLNFSLKYKKGVIHAVTITLFNIAPCVVYLCKPEDEIKS